MVIGLFSMLQTAPAAESKVDQKRFQTQVAPILEKHCVTCHGPEDPESGFRLDTKAHLLKGGYTGKIIVPGSAKNSPLFQMVSGTHKDETVMPPEGDRLTKAELAILKTWINAGLHWPKGITLKAKHKRPPEPSKHWAYQPIITHQPPAVRNTNWPRNSIDRFVLTRLEQLKLTPSPAAVKRTLIRRVTFDLIGLPPTPEEIDNFLADNRPGAYERLVSRLLASPHYGERWARPWLDLCHFAESDGYLTDQIRPVAWRYRSWLISALNTDMPFNQFTIEQLAGDLLPNATIDQKLATGFLRNTLSNREGGADLEEFRVEQVIDRTLTVGTVWLGMTLECSRCHDHKYDPVSQKEFYEFNAFFDSANEINIDAPLPDELAPYLENQQSYETKRQKLITPIKTDLEKLQKRWEVKLLFAKDNPGKDYVWDRKWEILGLVWGGNLGEGQLEGCEIAKLPWSKRTQLQKGRLLDYFLKYGSEIDSEEFKRLKLSDLRGKLQKLKEGLPKLTRAPTMMRTQNHRQAYLHVRGDFRSRGIDVQPNTFSVLPDLAKTDEPRRLTMARWLVSPENPLSARVTVNRIWQEFFGSGFVSTSEDFGKQGAPPTHPKLLDWLAAEFMRDNWSVKSLHKLIVTSATYRQSSVARPKIDRNDSNNQLLARQTPLRLSAEQVRDAVLFSTGLLYRKLDGPSVFPPQPDSVSMEGFENKWVASSGREKYRRGLYTFTQRTSPFSQSVTFDSADPSRTCTRRERSNTPLQALALLNDPVFYEAASALAKHVSQKFPQSESARIDAAFELALGRLPEPKERDRLIEFREQQLELLLKSSASSIPATAAEIKARIQAESASWTGLCSIILNLHEFITRD